MAIALSIAPASRTIPIDASSAGSSPILILFRAWQSLQAAADVFVADDSLGIDEHDELLDRLFFDRADEIAKELMALPCTSAADFAAKLVVSTLKGTCIEEWDTGEIWAEARALTGISA